MKIFYRTILQTFLSGMLVLGGCKDSSTIVNGIIPPPDLEVGKWRLIGLEGERVQTIAVNHQYPNIIYAGTGINFDAGTSGKLYKTSDWGQTWVTLVHDVHSTVVVLDPIDNIKIYAVFGTANFTKPGILKSTDGGISWIHADSGIYFGVDGIRIASLVLDLINTNVIYAGTAGFWPGSLYKSTDAGGSWINLGQVGTGPAVGSLKSNIISITLDPWNEGVIYVGTTNNLLKSTDGGITWDFTALREDGKGVGAFESSAGAVNAIVVSKHKKDRIYFRSQSGFNRSDDGGQSYITFNSGLPMVDMAGFGDVVSVSSIIEHPAMKGKIYLTARTESGYTVKHNLFYSNNFGESWVATGDTALVYVRDIKMTSNSMYIVTGANNGVYLFRIN